MEPTFDCKQCLLHSGVVTKIEEQDKALSLARAQLDKRLEGMNEFREQLKDQAGKFITRDELNLITSIMEKDIRELTRIKDETQGKASISSVYISWFLALIALFIGIFGLLK